MAEEHNCADCNNQECEIRNLIDDCLNKDKHQHLVTLTVKLMVTTPDSAKLKEDVITSIGGQINELIDTLVDDISDYFDISDHLAYPISTDVEFAKLSKESAITIARKLKHG